MTPLVIALIAGIAVALIGFGMCGWNLKDTTPKHPGRAKQGESRVIGLLVVALGSVMVIVTVLIGIYQLLQGFLAR